MTALACTCPQASQGTDGLGEGADPLPDACTVERGQADVALGYASWTAYIAAEFADALPRLDRAQRQEVVAKLSAKGMSTRAIAPVVGADNATVHRDLAAAMSEADARLVTMRIREAAAEYVRASQEHARLVSQLPAARSYEPDDFVYFVQAGPGGNVKIGRARDVAARIATLQTGCPVPLRLLGVIPDAGASTETRLHKAFAADRVHGEWFHPSQLLEDVIDDLCVRRTS